MAELAVTPADSTLDTSREQMKALSGQIGGFLAGSEDVFLDAGSRLTGLERQARSLVDVSRRAVTRGSGQPDQDPVDQMDRELGGLERYLGASREASGAGLEGLTRILAGAEAISGARGACEDITRTLRVLGMYTRIENSRDGARSEGMETVIAEVRRLGDLIEPLFRAMLDLASGLGKTATGARAGAQDFSARQKAWSAQMLEEARVAMESLRALAAAQAAVASRAVSAAEEVVRNVTEILVALQIHDATRQMIEHAVEELGAFERDAASASLKGPLEAGAWLAEVFELCRLLAAQLRGARERLVEALGQIAGNLRTMVSRVVELGEETGRLAGTGEDGSPVERVERGVGHATAALREHLANEKELAAALGRVVETGKGIGVHACDIWGIGTAVKIISLNALVETERAGEGGRVLAVLAHWIGMLAVEVVARMQAVSGSLDAIKAAVKALGSGHSAEEVSAGATIAANLEDLVALLGSYHGDLEAGAVAIRDGSQALRDEVEGIAGRLEQQSDVVSSLARVEDELQRLAAQAAPLARPAGSDQQRVRQSSAASRYTTDAERQIHERVLEHPAAATHATPATQADPAVPTGGELGDNVELF